MDTTLSIRLIKWIRNINVLPNLNLEVRLNATGLGLILQILYIYN